MLGIEDYGSDASDTELDNNQTSQPDNKGRSLQTSSSNGLSLPPPKATSGPGLSLPPPKAKRAPKKIAIGLPSLPDPEKEEQEEDARPAAKKPRLEAGAGAGKWEDSCRRCDIG